MKVQCPNCKRIFWETTDKYDPNKTPNGSMVKQLEPYKSNHWPIFGDGVMRATAGTLAAEMDCPACLAQLAPSGRLRVIPDPVSEEEDEGLRTEDSGDNTGSEDDQENLGGNDQTTAPEVKDEVQEVVTPKKTRRRK